MLHRAILRMTLRTTLAVASACAAVLVLPGCDDASTPKAEYTVSIVSPGLGDVLFPNREIAFRAELSGLPDDVDPASIRFDWRFGDGQEIVGGGEEVSHAYIAPGTWSVSVAARQTEGDKTGSVARASETFTTSPPADLIPRSPAVLLSAANLTSSDTFRVSFDLENLAAPTLLPFEVAIYALDADVDAPADIAALQTLVTARQAFIVADRTLQPMPSAPARQNIDFENLRMPASAPTGTYRVLAVADANDRIGEDNESDNAQFGDRGFAFANTESRGPNLRVRDVTVRPPRANELSNLIIDAVVYNVGSQPALLFDFDVWLSRDPQWDEGDRLLAQDRIASVPANAIQEVEGLAITLDPPVTELGEYFVIVRADSDNDVEEILETDNVAASGVVTVTDEQLPGADIAVSQVQVAPLNTFLDGSIEVRAKVENAGTEDIPVQFLCRIYLSGDDQLSTRDDEVLDSVTIAPLAAGAATDLLRDSTIPGFFDPGSYFVFVYCDPNLSIAESDDGNNVSRAPTPIEVAGEASIDLRIESLEVTPTDLDNEAPLTVTVEVCNDGTNGSTPGVLRALLSQDDLSDASDIVLAETRLAPLEPRACASIVVTAPAICATFVDTYRVVVVVDATGSVPETDEGNNEASFDGTVTIRGSVCACAEDPYEPNESPTRPFYLDPEVGSFDDLTMCSTAIEWYAIPLFRGESLRARIRFERARGNLDMVLYGPDRATVLDTSSTDGDLEEVSYLSAAQRGDYLLKVFGRTPTDRNVYDLELNVTSALPGTDIVVLDVGIDAARPLLGATVNLSFDVVNLGTDDAPDSLARVYLSDDPDIDPVEDLRLTEVVVPTFSERVERTIPVTLPDSTGGGAFYIGVVGDARNEVPDEIDETNNTGVSPIFVIDAACFDTLEPNNAADAPRELVAPDGEPTTLAGLLVCSDNRDFYRVCVQDGDDLTMSVAFDPGFGDVDLRLTAADGTIVDRSEGTGGDESVSVDFVTGDQCYTLEVYVAGRDREVPYTLEVDSGRAPAELQCSSDGEPNNGFSVAAPLRDWLDADVAICPESDDDYYRVGPLAVGARVVFGLDPIEGAATVPSELRLSLWRNAATFISNTVTAAERLTYVAAVPNEIIYVRVRSTGSGPRNQPYQLHVEGLGGTDLIASGFSVAPGIAIPGQQVAYAFEIANAFDAEAAPSSYALYLSADPGWSADDLLLRRVDLGAIAGLSSLVEGRKVTIPPSFTGVGRFWVVLRLDDTGVVTELSERNNVYAEPIEILGVCEADLSEPNDFAIDATSADDAEGLPLSICPGDVDWFTLPVLGGRRVNVTISFDHDVADLDLYVYDDARTLVGSSDTLGDTESVSLVPARGGSFLIEVRAFDSAATGRYTLTAD